MLQNKKCFDSSSWNPYSHDNHKTIVKYFRLHMSITTHHWKGFYCPNCQQTTQIPSVTISFKAISLRSVCGCVIVCLSTITTRFLDDLQRITMQRYPDFVFFFRDYKETEAMRPLASDPKAKCANVLITLSIVIGVSGYISFKQFLFPFPKRKRKLYLWGY